MGAGCVPAACSLLLSLLLTFKEAGLVDFAISFRLAPLVDADGDKIFELGDVLLILLLLITVEFDASDCDLGDRLTDDTAWLLVSALLSNFMYTFRVGSTSLSGLDELVVIGSAAGLVESFVVVICDDDIE
jgi:hypothetical protein